MSLELNKLEKVVELGDGVKRARCPACAEGGQDRKGEHLRIYPDGRFGCCVYPKDHEHRKRIFALAGERGRQAIKIRVAEAHQSEAIQSGILGRLGRVFQSPEAGLRPGNRPDASDGVSQVQPKPAEIRTPRTAAEDAGQLSLEYSRTPRTPLLLLTREARQTVEDADNKEAYKQLIEFGGGVRTVRCSGETEPPSLADERLPFLTADGSLSIPFDSPARYHWWKLDGERLTVAEIRIEAQRRMNDAVTV